MSPHCNAHPRWSHISVQTATGNFTRNISFLQFEELVFFVLKLTFCCRNGQLFTHHGNPNYLVFNSNCAHMHCDF